MVVILEKQSQTFKEQGTLCNHKVLYSQLQFSTSVELESENVCVCVCVCDCARLWGSLQGPKIVGFGWNLVHLYLGWIPGVVVSIGHVGPVLAQNGPKSSGQPTEPKKCWTWLKFGTLVPWVNTWGCFFHFFKIFIFGPQGPFLVQIGPKWTKNFGAAHRA